MFARSIPRLFFEVMTWMIGSVMTLPLSGKTLGLKLNTRWSLAVQMILARWVVTLAGAVRLNMPCSAW